MYTRKTKDVYVLQGNYGCGWESVLEEDKRKDAMERLKEYRENQPQYPHKVIKKRVHI